MKAVIICPDRRAEVAFLARRQPLALLPLCGTPVLFQWLTVLADRGVQQVIVLASDRPDAVRTAVAAGERWGLPIEVCAEARQTTVAEAQSRFPEATVVLADRLPALPESPLLASYANFSATLARWVPQAGVLRVGAKETAPGVWTGLRSRVESGARLIAPCWVGEDVWVRRGAVIGPEAVIEDASVVDHDAEVTSSWVGPRTYVGAMTHVNRSLAWGNGLLNHENGSFTEVVDLFLLSDLHGGTGFDRQPRWYGRLAALMAAVLTSPVLLLAALRGRRSGQPVWVRKQAVLPGTDAWVASARELEYAELNGVTGLARRWPQLWDIVRGRFCWVGNRPLAREQVAQLESEFERLWLAAPLGFVSLADTYGCGDQFDDESRAHSSFYAAQGVGRLDGAVLRSCLWPFTRKPPTPTVPS